MGAAFLFSLSAFYIVASQKACPGTGPCTISCSQTDDCVDQTIDCGNASSCDVVCGGSACVRANFTWNATPSSPNATYSIQCAGGSACEYAVINWPEWGPKAAGLTCSSQASCRGASSIVAPEGSAFDFDCNQGHACNGVTIRCPTNADCDIHCLGSNSCRDVIMWCPVEPNRCSTECGGDFSCYGLQQLYLTFTPSTVPTVAPSAAPTTAQPTLLPTSVPTSDPTSGPTLQPTRPPTTADPTVSPTIQPTALPNTPGPTTTAPTTALPTASPTSNPTRDPGALATRRPTTATQTATQNDDNQGGNQAASGFTVAASSMLPWMMMALLYQLLPIH